MDNSPNGRPARVLLLVAGFIDDLVAGGLVSGAVSGAPLLSEAGRQSMEQIRASGFAPTEEEFSEAFAVLSDLAAERTAPKHGEVCLRCGCADNAACHDRRLHAPCCLTHLDQVCSACLTEPEFELFLSLHPELQEAS